MDTHLMFRAEALLALLDDTFRYTTANQRTDEQVIGAAMLAREFLRAVTTELNTSAHLAPEQTTVILTIVRDTNATIEAILHDRIPGY